MRIAAIDIGGTAIKYGLSDEFGNITNTGERPTEAKIGGGQGVMDKVMEILASLAPFDRVGVSTGGVVNVKEGSIHYANENIPGYTGIRIKDNIQAVYPVPVAVLNDVHAAAVGEAIYGAGRGVDNFLCLTYGTGVGGAIYADGKLLTGRCGAAGHLGHIIIHSDNGKPCGCGNFGCYESYASVTALCALMKERTGETLNGRQIFARLDEPVIAKGLSDWIDEIVLGLVSLIQAFDPECVIMGGGIFSEELLMGEIRKRVDAKVMPILRGVKLVRAELSNNAGMLGAVHTVLQV